MNELEWLTEHRPDVAEPDEAPPRTPGRRCWHTRPASRPARGADVGGGRRPGGRRAAPPRRPRKAPLYALAVAVFAIAIVVAASALPSGEGPAPRIARQSASLRRPKRRSSSSRVGSAAGPDRRRDARHPPPGLPEARTSPAPTLSRRRPVLLRADARGAAGQRQGRRPRRGRHEARARSGEGRDSAQGRPGAAQDDRCDVRAKASPRRAAASTRPRSPRDARSSSTSGSDVDARAQDRIDNNRVWIGSMDALIAGAGETRRTCRRDGLLATIGASRVRITVRRCRDAQHGVPRGYEETLTVDAKTGVIAEDGRRRRRQAARVVVTTTSSASPRAT